MRFASDRSNNTLREDFYLNNVKTNKGALLNNTSDYAITNYIAPSNNYIVYTPDVTIFHGCEYIVVHNINSLCTRYYDTNVYIEDGFINGDMLKCLEHSSVYPYKYCSYILSLSDIEYKNFLFNEKRGYKEVVSWLSEKVIQAIDYKASKGF